ncbi:aldolase/citrate lyase family protein [Devosia rhodophyticola]|uniref:Aldolase/citrate lyase family protein n=1 Tax=Devosia rhodophyticola TaxID=3026423 RepID=A0ABY7YXT2_9HYPH|nr:aldolase/citrate lyase family protein [Devosia rhodophyticola]WDR06200.1 aldolase/citrate lyase family protein [Devosia rhodophyticola]
MTSAQPYTAGPATRFAMRPSRVLRTIREGRVARVLKLNTSDAKVAEVFASAQPDAIWLCMEHTSASFEQIENQIRAAKLYDVDTLVRVARGSYSDYIRPLEMDATGLIVPHVMNLADATMVRDFTKFAPAGKRAVDGGNNDAMFTRVSFLDYLATANQERFVCHQIEDPEALDDLERIAELDGVDALFFGPGDFSVALGIPGQIQHPEIKAVRKKVAEVARKHGKIAATVGGPDVLGEYVDMGYNLINVGADVIALANYADEMLSAFDRL